MAPPASPSRRVPPVLVLGLVLGLLVVVGVTCFARLSRHSPSQAQVHADFARIQAALDAYRRDGHALPEEGDLSFLAPKYLPEPPLDPWGRPYEYLSNGERVILSTLGADGRHGGVGEDEDHTSTDGHPAP
ncbi:type II secretion system protein G [Aggregicoccus sp. 17bor-14]|uniref:type II secretion system protein GspG n=1 Tax=Myxococcaceae TaxID=31 RepID=UPI00129C6F95|nr:MULTISPECIES: type II secretion system protein GspG [Myxococcaceae]MBF5045377.1 type II secretion system protein GspG [Simulacricoccus sp. 17bor-14]MRI91119.1 type II secretion system protein G [Aggregicoccus sp. 17bor-14]